MAKKIIKIESINGGWASNARYAASDQFSWSEGIDPDKDIDTATGSPQPSGMLSPTAYSKFSGANVNKFPIAIITTPKDTNIYVVLKNGRLISYTSSFGSETLIGTVTGSNADGATYYNNYIYIFGTGASKDDVSRYGPLNNSPTLVDNVWKGATLGSQTALTNTQYPTLNFGGDLLNHWGHVHTDSALYFCDVVNGQGVIHKIKTTKTTDEGDTNNGSTFNVLDLPIGFLPTDIESYGTDLIVLATSSSQTTVIQGLASLFLWDTISDSFYRQVPLLDSLATAIINHNGVIKIWSGAGTAGNVMRLSAYYGGFSVSELKGVTAGFPPAQGAVDFIGDRIIFGTSFSVSSTQGNQNQVLSYGSIYSGNRLGFHSIAKGSSSSGTGVSALKVVRTSGSSDTYGTYPQMIFGWDAGGGTAGIDKSSDSASAVGTSWQSSVYTIGNPFTVKTVKLVFASNIGANTNVRLKFVLDAGVNSSSTLTIDSTSFSGNCAVVDFGNSSSEVRGFNDLSLLITWVGSTEQISVLLPIIIEVETEEWTVSN